MLRLYSRVSACAVGLLTVGALGGSVPAAASEDDMNLLPVIEPFRCLACHVVATPTSSADADLNPFGEDYLDNGRIWDQALAYLDSDGDSCNNGTEIGDVDGDGDPDENVDRQAGNPGVQDECQSGGLVEERTWSALKAIFDGRKALFDGR